MKIPEFYRGDSRSRSATKTDSLAYNRRLAERAEAAWHALGHHTVRFDVIPASVRQSQSYLIRSNLVNGLPPKGEK